MLSENGFIENVSDAKKLKDTAYVERIARGHVNDLAKVSDSRKKATRLIFNQLSKIKLLSLPDIHITSEMGCSDLLKALS